MEIPPRVRGRGVPSGTTVPTGGNTPACAGKSRRRSFHFRQDRKYPRVCGEETPIPAILRIRRKYPRVCGEERSWHGLPPAMMEIPPRVRGRELTNALGHLQNGNTPACAGKSLHNVTLGLLSGKYPRVCGEERRSYRNRSS